MKHWNETCYLQRIAVSPRRIRLQKPQFGANRINESTYWNILRKVHELSPFWFSTQPSQRYVMPNRIPFKIMQEFVLLFVKNVKDVEPNEQRINRWLFAPLPPRPNCCTARKLLYNHTIAFFVKPIDVAEEILLPWLYMVHMSRKKMKRSCFFQFSSKKTKFHERRKKTFPVGQRLVFMFPQKSLNIRKC